MKVAGIDFSLTSPSVCLGSTPAFSETDLFFFSSNQTFRKNLSGTNLHILDYPVYITQLERYDKLSDAIYDIVKHCDLIVLEGYSLGSHGRIFNIAEATGLLKYKLWKADKHLVTVPPTVIKKFATGKGNSNKDAMYSSFVQQNQIDLKALFGFKGKKTTSPISDVVDSYYIYSYGIQFYTKLVSQDSSY